MIAKSFDALRYCGNISSGHCKVHFITCFRTHLDGVLRKLIPQLQTFPQRIQEATMVRFYSSVHADDEMLIRKMSGDTACHGIPHQSLPHIEHRPNAAADCVPRSPEP